LPAGHVCAWGQRVVLVIFYFDCFCHFNATAAAAGADWLGRAVCGKCFANYVTLNFRYDTSESAIVVSLDSAYMLLESEKCGKKWKM